MQLSQLSSFLFTILATGALFAGTARHSDVSEDPILMDSAPYEVWVKSDFESDNANWSGDTNVISHKMPGFGAVSGKKAIWMGGFKKNQEIKCDWWGDKGCLTEGFLTLKLSVKTLETAPEAVDILRVGYYDNEGAFIQIAEFSNLDATPSRVFVEKKIPISMLRGVALSLKTECNENAATFFGVDDIELAGFWQL